MLQLLMIVGYGAIAFSFFQLWFEAFQNDTELESAKKGESLIFLVVMTIFWPIVVPLAYRELVKAQIKNK